MIFSIIAYLQLLVRNKRIIHRSDSFDTRPLMPAVKASSPSAGFIRPNASETKPAILGEDLSIGKSSPLWRPIQAIQLLGGFLFLTPSFLSAICQLPLIWVCRATLRSLAVTTLKGPSRPNELFG